MFFNQIPATPPDPILGLTEAFRNDSRPEKVNLGVGIFVDERGATPVLDCIRQAGQQLQETEKTKNYLPISGAPEYGEAVSRLICGAEFSGLATGRVAVTQAPGGTGALRIGAEFLRQFRPGATIWVPTPTWDNHKKLFGAAGFAIKDYPYYSSVSHAVDVDAMCAGLAAIPADDIVLLHVCCHNPTGGDVDAAGWQRVAEIAVRRGWLPFFDFAYQGFGDGLEEDRRGLQTVLAQIPEALVAYSFSKNMGLYSERVGALLMMADDSSAARAVLSQVKRIIRVIYSNPPKHGAALAQTVLTQPGLYRRWVEEVTAMRQRIAANRRMLADGLSQRVPEQDFSFITRQKGMFSYSGLSDAQVDFLREEKAIYMVKGGRINVAGLMAESLDYVCDSIAASLNM